LEGLKGAYANALGGIYAENHGRAGNWQKRDRFGFGELAWQTWRTAFEPFLEKFHVKG
jgi:hypothetical protein